MGDKSIPDARAREQVAAQDVESNKTLARVGVALGVTMVIVGWTGSAWLKRKPTTAGTEEPLIHLHRMPAPPGAAQRRHAAPPPPVSPQPLNPSPGDRRLPPLDYRFLRAQLGLAVRRLRGDPELAALDRRTAKESPAARRALARAAPPADWPEGFSPALFATKALAYATAIVFTLASAGVYATCRHYDAWDAELLAYDIANTMRRRLQGIKPFFDRHLPNALRSPDVSSDEDKSEHKPDEEGGLFSDAWWRDWESRASEGDRAAIEEKRARLNQKIAERDERQRVRRSEEADRGQV